jgi:hypothetical protein
MENKELYISCRKSLDSYRDVVLAEIELIEGEKEKEKFANAVTARISELLKGISAEFSVSWREQNAAQAEKFRKHADALLSLAPPSDCPPGFEFNGKICVRI